MRVSCRRSVNAANASGGFGGRDIRTSQEVAHAKATTILRQLGPLSHVMASAPDAQYVEIAQNALDESAGIVHMGGAGNQGGSSIVNGDTDTLVASAFEQIAVIASASVTRPLDVGKLLFPMNPEVSGRVPCFY
jgi:hypothetical protein